MIIIAENSSASTIYVPKHFSATSSLTFTLKSRLTNDEYVFDVEDLSGYTDFFFIEIDTSTLNDGEYEYRVKDGDKTVSSGLLRIGKYKAGKEEYEYTQEYTEYTPL